MTELKRKQEDEAGAATKVAKTEEKVAAENSSEKLAEADVAQTPNSTETTETTAEDAKESAKEPANALEAETEKPAEPKKSARSKYGDLEEEDDEDSEDDDDFDEDEFDEDDLEEEEEELSEVEIEEGSRRRTRVDYKKVLAEMEKEEAANLADEDDGDFTVKE